MYDPNALIIKEIIIDVIGKILKSWFGFKLLWATQRIGYKHSKTIL